MRIEFLTRFLLDHLQGDMVEGTVNLLKKVSAIRKMASAIIEVKGGPIGSLPSYSHVPVAPL
jgi:hypothetical protein